VKAIAGEMARVRARHIAKRHCATPWTILLLVVWGGVDAENWNTWPKCGREDEDPSNEPTAATVEGLRVYQLIGITADGKLSMTNPEAQPGMQGFLNAIKAEEDVPLHVVVFFGSVKTGKSTVATMASCAFWSRDETQGTSGQEEPALFPPQNLTDVADGGEAKHHTWGLWVSPPFTHNGRRFLLMDVEGLGNLPVDGVSGRKHNNGLSKLVTLLTEITSVFVLVLKTGEIEETDFSPLGTALTTTRRNLVKGSKSFSINAPALILTVRVHHLPKYLDGNTWEMSAQKLDGYATHQFGRLCEAKKDLADQLLNDFQNYEASTAYQCRDRKSKQMSLALAPFPHMGGRIVDDRRGATSQYAWEATAPFSTAVQEDHCEYFRDMGHENWKCIAGKEPQTVPFYKLAVDHLIDQIVQKAKPRVFNWSGGEKTLDGNLFLLYVQAGIDEMNAATLASPTETWQRLIIDNVNHKLTTAADEILGPRAAEEHDDGSLQKTVSELPQAVLDHASEEKPIGARTILERLVNAQQAWSISAGIWRSRKEKLFKEVPEQVQESCKTHAREIEADYQRQFDAQARADQLAMEKAEETAKAVRLAQEKDRLAQEKAEETAKADRLAQEKAGLKDDMARQKARLEQEKAEEAARAERIKSRYDELKENQGGDFDWFKSWTNMARKAAYILAAAFIVFLLLKVLCMMNQCGCFTSFRWRGSHHGDSAAVSMGMPGADSRSLRAQEQQTWQLQEQLRCTKQQLQLSELQLQQQSQVGRVKPRGLECQRSPVVEMI